jgi:hypothetical protein
LSTCNHRITEVPEIQRVVPVLIAICIHEAGNVDFVGTLVDKLKALESQALSFEIEVIDRWVGER